MQTHARLPILLVRTSGLASAWISSAPPSSTSASATAYSSRPASTGRPSIRAWTPSALDMHASLRPMMNTFSQQDGDLELRCLPWIRSRHARNSISSSYDSVVAAIYRIVLVTTWPTGNTANVTVTTRLHVSTTPGGDFVGGGRSNMALPWLAPRTARMPTPPTSSRRSGCRRWQATPSPSGCGTPRPCC